MIIKIKPILIKDNEWQPSEQIFWNEDKLNKIIIEEKLNEDMICIQNVSFDSITQQLSNVEFDCYEYFDKINKKYIIEPIIIKKTKIVHDFNIDDINDCHIKSSFYRLDDKEPSLIKTNNNEWSSDDNKYTDVELLNIFKELPSENWTLNCILKDGIEYDIKFNPYIYYIEINNKFYWTYTINQEYDNMQKVYLTLQIDTVSSNLSKFNKGEFKGYAYVERTNNIKEDINMYHSNSCSSIENKDFEIIQSEKNIPQEIDTFIVQTGLKENKNIVVRGSSTKYPVTTTLLGSVIDTSTGVFIAYSATSTLPNKIKNHNLPEKTINQMLAQNSSSSTFNDNEWIFYKEEDATSFNTELRNSYNGSQFKDLEKLTGNEQNIKSWISVPRFFDIENYNSIYSEFDLTIDEIPEVDLSNHLELHYNYYLVIGKTFKIPLDYYKLKNKTLYVSRTIISTGSKFSFFYEKERITVFYSVELTSANGMRAGTWQEQERQLNLQYNSGLKGSQPIIEELFRGTILSLLGTLVGGPIGTAFALTEIVSIPFNLYKNSKQENYEKSKIESVGYTEKQVLLYEALKDLMIVPANIASWGSITIDGINLNQYFILTNDKMVETEIHYNLLIEKPILRDINKIKLDQNMYGNIVNQTKILDNPLQFNDLIDNHLFWQGKILPDVCPVNNLELNVLNVELAKGVYIKKGE